MYWECHCVNLMHMYMHMRLVCTSTLPLRYREEVFFSPFRSRLVLLSAIEWNPTHDLLSLLISCCVSESSLFSSWPLRAFSTCLLEGLVTFSLVAHVPFNARPGFFKSVLILQMGESGLGDVNGGVNRLAVTTYNLLPQLACACALRRSLLMIIVYSGVGHWSVSSSSRFLSAACVDVDTAGETVEPVPILRGRGQSCPFGPNSISAFVVSASLTSDG